MSSVPIDAFNMRVTEQGYFQLEEDTNQTERSQWVLNSPNPPPLWKKLISPLKKNKFFFPSKKRTCHEHALSFLGNLFPILSLFKNYDAYKFKDDFLAGLTLASLSIPQMDSELVGAVDQDLRKILINPNARDPFVLGVRLWPQATPQFLIGHLDLPDAA